MNVKTIKERVTEYKSYGGKISRAANVYELIEEYAALDRENFLVVTLSGSHIPIAVRIVSIGILNRAIVHPREVFACAVHDRAAAIIVAHNHPSGSIEASEEDIAITKRLSDAGELLGIPVLDHLILGNGYYSFAENGVMMYGYKGACEPEDDVVLRMKDFVDAADVYARAAWQMANSKGQMSKGNYQGSYTNHSLGESKDTHTIIAEEAKQ